MLLCTALLPVLCQLEALELHGCFVCWQQAQMVEDQDHVCGHRVLLMCPCRRSLSLLAARRTETGGNLLAPSSCSRPRSGVMVSSSCSASRLIFSRQSWHNVEPNRPFQVFLSPRLTPPCSIFAQCSPRRRCTSTTGSMPRGPWRRDVDRPHLRRNTHRASGKPFPKESSSFRRLGHVILHSPPALQRTSWQRVPTG